ncbi:MAG: hypothetical protein CL605_03675 [Altibacter sp.]|uniref:hypothetical protein n=1 Tax=Altibacter sp. TaxID=2024823 RepID=UPI000C8F1932|nr:hypothetical protein [Altibacter sp.]MAP53980.1 hypothetical protein [Altibacter sp.]
MNEYGHSETEELIYGALKREYGEVWEKMDEEIVQKKIDASKKLYEIAVDDFRKNQSAFNYNILITAMLSLQYWNQKKTKLFSLTEDF